MTAIPGISPQASRSGSSSASPLSSASIPPMAIAAAFIFRLNKLTCITGSWINTPLTVVPVLGLSYKLGRITARPSGARTPHKRAGMAASQG